MRKILLSTLIVFLSLNFSFGQNNRDTVTAETPIFKVVYSELMEQPLNLKYSILCPGPGVSRKGMDFFEVDSIRTSNDSDYYKNVWDKGHLAPAASFNCDRETLKSTFSYLNCALQHERLNRGEWRLLEDFERKLSERGNGVEVEVEVIFDSIPERVPSGAAIPLGFLKHVTINKTIHFCFFFLNEETNRPFMMHRIHCKKHGDI